MSTSIWHTFALSLIYGVLLGGCLWGMMMLTEGQTFPLLHHKLLLAAGCFAAGATWILLWAGATALGQHENRRV